LRQNLYTCCRCGREQRTAIESDDAPLGWAAVTYRRDHVDTIEGEHQMMCTSLATHACGSCYAEVLAFLEKVTPSTKEVDSAFDDGGAA
jgi:thioesterase domain-containing protein